ncbi:Maf family nucleotide pyrophosphatase [Flavimarina sp. Hel_I_48]|uniref:Maf family nucleotide pyrophosphatase n=1 Tax=Flavimarina sp. Hel_I_48 TaxID=1392488 RepID=UPI0004DF63C9|nr:Maf family nucleotide pyrophosphatase [Flavimarina sp. Hel_I_48]
MLHSKLSGKQLVLASQSPRRKELLKAMDLDFEVLVRPVDESYPSDLSPSAIAEHIALAKAEVFRKDLKPDQIVITGDTIVVFEEQILGKPKTTEEAHTILTNLSGKKHRVISSLCLMNTTKILVDHDTAFVHFKEFSPEEISYYIDNYSPMDKAGAYGIQEWLGHIGLVKLEGSYNTVMGLPTQLLYQMLQAF